jgi:tetratricopeptide (TPR) repeat protein
MFTVNSKIINSSKSFDNNLFGYNLESPNQEYSTNVSEVFFKGWVLPRDEKEAEIVIEGNSISQTFPCDLQRDDVTKKILGQINPNIKCGFHIEWHHTGIFNISFVVEGEKMLIAEIEITSCREIEIVEDSNQASVYFQLGKDQEQEGNIEEAIASYLEAVKLSLGNFSYCQGLSEALIKINQPHHWEQAITIYRRIISKNPNSIWGIYFLGFSLQNTQQFEAACQAYQNAISINPDFFWAYFSLGNCAKEMQQWEEAIIAYQRALELNPGYTSLNSDIAEAYYQLGKKYIEQNQLEEAAQCYQKALEKQHYQKLAYYDLQEMIAKGFYELGLQNAETGKLSAGIKCFENVSLMQTKGNIYDHIWRGLNSLGFLDETSFYCEIDIRREAVEAYFANTSTYRIISLWDVKADDKEYLKKVDLSLVQIELTHRDQRSLEEIYMNSFLENPIEKYPQQELRNERLFQQSIIETGYIYSVCPFSGKIIRSNQSYVIGGIWPTPVHFYRFVGQEIFYLLVGDWIGDKMYIYIPSLELIIQLRHLLSNLQGAHLFNKFKGYMVSEWKQVLSYLSNPHKQLGAVLGFFWNIGHYTWNDLTGIQYLYERDMLTKIDKFIVGSWEYFNVADVWPEEIIPSKRIQVEDPLNLFQTVLVNNCFTFRVTDFFIKEDMTNRITKGSYQRCSQEFLQQIEIAKQHFPLVCFQLRTHIRLWLSQVEGIANIINKLSKDYPDLGVVFDGWSRTEIDSPGDDKMIALENEEVAKIIDRLDARTKIYNAIGCRTYEKVVWAQAVDTYIAPVGSGLTFLNQIANKRGIVHGEVEFTEKANSNFLLYQENWNPYLLVPGYHREGDHTPVVHRNYDCDWNAIYDEVVKIIDGLSKKDKKTGIN